MFRFYRLDGTLLAEVHSGPIASHLFTWLLQHDVKFYTEEVTNRQS